MPAAGVRRHAAASRERNLERALREERLALVAVAEVALRYARDPDALVGRLERVAEAHVQQPRTPAATRRALAAAATAARNARAIELGKPQALFDPSVGHVPPSAVVSIADGADPGQTSLFSPVELLDWHDELDRRLAERLVALFAATGATTDAELVEAYRRDGGVVSRSHITRIRVELVRRGRLVRTGERRDGHPLFDLPERSLHP